jgi:hypothetical protein
MKGSWVDTETSSVLDLDVIVVRVVADGTGWNVESSHGDPSSARPFPTRDAAKAHATTFARSLIERTSDHLARAAEVEDSPSNGWHSPHLGLLSIHVPPAPHFVDKTDGEVLADVFEQEKSNAVAAARTRLAAAKQAITPAAAPGRKR